MNVQHRMFNGKDEETEIAVKRPALDVCFSFDVGCSMFNVRRSSLKTTQGYGMTSAFNSEPMNDHAHSTP